MKRGDSTAELLRILRTAGGLVSGQQLADALRISRTAVWKQISALRQAGYRIDAQRGGGYHLSEEPDRLSEQLLRSSLTPGCLIGRKIISVDQTDSTNADTFTLAEQGEGEGLVFLADSQLKGKGRLGRNWVSPAGVNLYCSILLRPQIPPFEAAQLTFLSAVAVARAIRLTTGLQPEIKWPNDLLLNGKKVAGLLNEMHAETDRVGFVILGIGVNLNMDGSQFPEDLRTPATSLAIETGKSVSRRLFTVCLLNELDAEYGRFLEFGFGPVREEWGTFCNASGKMLQVLNEGAVVEGAFAGLDHDGAMLLQVADGTLERIMTGDVSFIG